MKENYSPPQFGAREAVHGVLFVCLCAPSSRGMGETGGHWWAGEVAGAEGTHTACGKRCWDLHVLDLADRGLRGNLIVGFRVLRVITVIRESNFSVV